MSAGREALRLVRPSEEHRDAAEAFRQEFFDCGERTISGSALLDRMSYPEWLAQTRRSSDPRAAWEDWVTADTFFALREGDDALVGMVNIRHSLEVEFLARWGGHIGYAVRPGERRKGYATEMLRRALAHARGLGLARVMLGCHAENAASRRTILRCCGVLAECKPDPDGRMTEIYWIELA